MASQDDTAHTSQGLHCFGEMASVEQTRVVGSLPGYRRDLFQIERQRERRRKRARKDKNQLVEQGMSEVRLTKQNSSRECVSTVLWSYSN